MSTIADGARETRPADPTVSAAAAVPPRLSVDGFDGPLDVLLERARAREIDLAGLSIAALIAAFAAALEAALADRPGVRLEPWASWTVTAATLTELWSRLMLPAESPAAQAATAEAEALRAQIASRAWMQAAADWLDRRVQLGQDVFRRGMPDTAAAVRGGDLTELLRACLPALRVPQAQAAALRPRLPPLWTPNEAIRKLLRLLPVLPVPSPLEAFLPAIAEDTPHRALRRRVALASTLVAGLELARTGVLALDQAADWMSIQVTRGENDCSVPADSARPA